PARAAPSGHLLGGLRVRGLRRRGGSGHGHQVDRHRPPRQHRGRGRRHHGALRAGGGARGGAPQGGGAAARARRRALSPLGVSIPLVLPLQRIGFPVTEHDDAPEYDIAAIEKKWRAVWDERKPFATDDPADNRPRKYILDMFPYPSGEL